MVEEDEYRRPIMQQGGDVGGLADRVFMPEFQHGFKSENYPYLTFARRHRLDYGLVIALIDVWRRTPKVQDQTATESKAVAWFNEGRHQEYFDELYNLFEAQHAVGSATKV